MDKYSAYLAFNDSKDVKPTNPIAHINDITEQTPPKEISAFVSKKLIEFIEIEIQKNKTKAETVNSDSLH